MPTRLTRCCRNQPHKTACPSSVLSTCSRSGHRSSAMSSLHLPVSMPALTVGMLAHLRRPFLVNANPWFLQPSGPDEEPTAILLTSSPQGSGAGDPPVGSPTRAATRVGLFLMEHPHCSDSHQYKERGEAARLEPWQRATSLNSHPPIS